MEDDAIGRGEEPGLIAFATADRERLDARAELAPKEVRSPVRAENPKEHEDAFGRRRRRRSEVGFVLHGLGERLDVSMLQVGQPDGRPAAAIAHIGEDVGSEESDPSADVARIAVAELQGFAGASALALESKQEQPRPRGFVPLEDQGAAIDVPLRMKVHRSSVGQRSRRLRVCKFPGHRFSPSNASPSCARSQSPAARAAGS
jgi:hypothetical protein